MTRSIDQRRPDDAIYLQTEDAAALLSLRASTLEKWRRTRSDGPPFIRIGRTVRYPRGPLLEWCDQYRRAVTPPETGNS
jgi:hypothetical protein